MEELNDCGFATKVPVNWKYFQATRNKCEQDSDEFLFPDTITGTAKGHSVGRLLCRLGRRCKELNIEMYVAGGCLTAAVQLNNFFFY